MQRALAEAVLRTLHDRPQTEQRETLAAFSVQQWRDCYRWLDASGIALYLLDQIKRLHWEASLPATVLARLEQNLEDNQARTTDLFAEFVRVNDALTDAGVRFVNVKGITLTPHACLDLCLRHQMDLDFIAAPEDADICRTVMANLGYTYAGGGMRVLEFKAGANVIPSIEDMYKPKPQRSVEIHFAGEDASVWLDRRMLRTLNGVSFPALCESDAFLLQARHLFKHLGEEWMRISWVLEFRRSVMSQLGNQSFWSDLHTGTEGDASIRTAIGAGIVIATQAFGECAPKEALPWTVESLDPSLHLWLARYGRKVILADFPGTKLYLLMPHPQKNELKREARSLREVLLPLHLPQRVVFGEPDESFLARIRRWFTQLSYSAFRLRFHVLEGTRYLLEALRWRRIAGSEQ